jgi:hypothetical protein
VPGWSSVLRRGAWAWVLGLHKRTIPYTAAISGTPFNGVIKNSIAWTNLLEPGSEGDCVKKTVMNLEKLGVPY